LTIQKIIRGFLEFRRQVLPSLSGVFSELAHAQEPTVLLVACSDSRIVPARILSSDPGEVFEVRTVGNLIAPADALGVSSGDLSEAAAIEYAVSILEVQDIVVLGHSSCGAMAALLKGKDAKLEAAPNLAAWLAHAAPALARRGKLGFDDKLGEADRLSQANVMVQLDHVATYPMVRAGIERGELELHGAWLDVGSGDLHLYDPDTSAFRFLDEREAARRLAVMDAPDETRPKVVS